MKLPPIAFMRFRHFGLGLSSLLILLSLVLIVTKGFNVGIDFAGGTLIEIGSERAISLEDVRSRVNNLQLGEAQIQSFGSETEAIIRVQADENTDVAALIENDIRSIIPDVSIRRVEMVGPKVGEELIQTGLWAVIAALAGILIYVWLRFDTAFGVASVTALLHDVILTLGLFSLLNLEFSLSVVAAILTIAGYSINDTVVVFDRIRENLRKYKKRTLSLVIDDSLNETLARTLVTSLTTLLALVCLFMFGGEVLRGFVAALIFGVVIGTYSSLFLASPLLILLGVHRGQDDDADGIKRDAT
ncbi:MAG: protein translocase subunit SecF [Alphaproteobacteria bacterium]|jgi:preprotein translocase SecF subunit|nr:protein translocase subunit SecF [Alphaproteobacteria bacterium]